MKYLIYIKLCIDSDYEGLKSALESSKEFDVNQYNLLVYRPLPNSSEESDGLINSEDNYQSDEELSDSGTMFDYRSPYSIKIEGLNALRLSCFSGCIRLVEYFLNLNFNVNITDKPSATDNYFGPLSNEYEHKIKMCEMDSHVVQDMRIFYYPLHIAVQQDSIELVKLLLNYKQKLHMKIKEPYTKRTALHIAAGKCSIEVLLSILLFF
ncbi:unnamed protein product [Rotaria sp. Silwood2]|nr:unnamed protein product [Rotaria sp. Silwood2]